MKYLQDSDGNTITVPEETYLFKRTVSFINWAIRGEFSTTFSILNDSETRKALGYRSINQINRPTSKVFAFVFDGTTVSNGKVFIQSAGNTFELFFIAGNANWINEITGSIRDLDLSAYNIPFDAQTIDSRKNATEGVIFPVIDWCYNYRKLTNAFIAKPITGVSIDSFYDFYPCFHEKTIFEKIFSSLGLKLDGNLLDNPVYKDLVLTPDVILSAAYQSAVSGVFQQMSGGKDSIFGSFAVVQLIMNEGSEYFDDSNNRLTWQETSVGITFTYSYQRESGAPQIDDTATIQLRKNGSTVSSFTIAGGVLSGSSSVRLDMAPGDYVEMFGYPNFQYTCQVTASFPQVISGNQAIVSNFLPDVHQFDFVRHIAQRFNCLVDFDDITHTVTFTMLDSIRKENAIDLSNDLVEFQQIPSGFSETNYIRTPEAEELVLYKSGSLNYGDSQVPSDGNGESDVIKTLFAPAETFTNQNLEWLITSVPLVRLEDADTGTDFTGVTNTGSLVDSFDNSSNQFGINVDEVIRIESTDYNGFAVASQVSDTEIKVYGNIPYVSNDTGKIYKQKIVFNNIGSRELLLVRNISINDFNAGSPIYGDQNIKIIDETGTYPYATAAWAFYAKKNIGTNMDNVKVGLNYGSVTGTSSIPFGDLYHRTLRKIIAAPKLKASFLFSQVRYQNLSLSRYVYLRTSTFEGYFLINDIEGFKNQYTPVQATLILID